MDFDGFIIVLLEWYQAVC